MNHSPLSSFSLNQAITGFLIYKSAEGLTPRSIDSYQRILEKWCDYHGDSTLNSITSQDILQYLNWLRQDYQPKRLSGTTQPLSPKTVRNIWITLSSFFHWAEQEFNLPNPMCKVPAPKYQNAPIEPFTQIEVKLMLKACLYSKQAETQNRSPFCMRRPTGRRDQAIILVLLDTGLRASEFCSLKIRDVDLKTGRVEVAHGSQGGAKGGKGRVVYLGKTARRTLWRYLAEQDEYTDTDLPLFVLRGDRPFKPDGLRHLINRIGKRAGIPGAYPHRFRHTFSVTYLRSGGDLFTLQALLGHTSLDMVRQYTKIAEIDLAQAHRRASPADNWGL
jgi:integrase/recombinase XerD